MHVVFLSQYERRRVLEHDELDEDRRRRQALPINAPMHTWRRRTRYRALLVARDGRDARSFNVIGVASVRTQGVFPSEKSALLEVGPWLLLKEPFPVATLMRRIAPTYRSHLTRIVDAEESRELPGATGDATADLLRSLVPDFGGLWDQLPEPGSPPRVLLRSADLPLLDAGQTALRLFTRRWNEIEPTREDVPATQAAASLERLARATENDFITDDATRFLDWELQGPSLGGWFEFQEGERQLLVKNINVSTPETKTGADLVYVSTSPPAVVLVQYKLLERIKTTDELVFRHDGRLADQVRRMTGLTNTSDGAGDHADIRLRDTLGFVKFIDPTERPTMSPRSVPIAGHYHPADLVAQMLRTPSVGPSGGAVHRVRGWRSIDGETFARLIRDRWVGSRGDVTKELLEILGLNPEREPLVLAVEERAGRSRTASGPESW